jgi:hypothetical protein
VQEGEVAHREFIDAKGVCWQAWEVIPSSAERRTGERRFGTRSDHDRRHREQVRAHLEDGMAHGWLVFESPMEKRRLHPIPPQWSDSSDEELAELCRHAEAATRPSERSPE